MTNEKTLYDKKVLIVGMDDFLGVHLVGALLSQRAHVYIYGHPESNNKAGGWGKYLLSIDAKFIPQVETPDNLPIGGIYDVVKNMDVVYHLEGSPVYESPMVGDRYAIKSRYAKFMEALNLLIACREAGVGRIVQVLSNMTVEEKYPDKPVEDAYLDMIDTNYESIKCDTEDLSRNFFEIYGLPIVRMDAQSAYGPHQNKREVIPALIDQVIRGKRSVHFNSTNTAREFTYITDVVEGLILAGITPGLEGMKFELNNGEKVSYFDLANMIAAKLERDIKVAFHVEEKMEWLSSPNNLLGGKVKVSKKLPGWSPKIHLDDGLMMTINWAKTTAQ